MSAAPSYKPQADSLAQRLIAHLARNPGQAHVVMEDIVEMFDVKRGNIHTQLALAVQAQVLQRDKDDDGEYVYLRGPRFIAQAPADAPGAPPRRQRASSIGARAAVLQALSTIDMATVPIDDAVPLPTPRVRGQDYTLLLQRLAKPQQSVALPIQLGGTLRKAITEAHKTGTARFAVRHISDTQLRVWRTE